MVFEKLTRLDFEDSTGSSEHLLKAILKYSPQDSPTKGYTMFLQSG